VLPAAWQKPDDKLRFAAQFEFLAVESLMMGDGVSINLFIVMAHNIIKVV
jgi:hypothetical protein